MSFFKKLFGGSGDSEGGDGSANDNLGGSADAVEHEGFTITPTPTKEGAQYRLTGTISKEVDGELKTHKFIRADHFASADECIEASIRKAKQVIKEQGERLFQ